MNLQSAYTSLLYSTVRIEAVLPNGATSLGTAFHLVFAIDGMRNLPVLITNKHIVRGAVRMEFNLHNGSTDDNGQVTGPDGSWFTVTMPGGESQWMMHPDDEVDLCAMPFEPLRLEAANHGKHPFIFPLPDSIIPNNEQLDNLSAMEDVVMAGYPLGLWDDVNNFPILRRGHTASHPVTDFQGKSQGAVDIACFPGSSGSPVLIVNEGAFATPSGLHAGTRVYLLGVLFAGPRFRAEGGVEIAAIPTQTRTEIPIHLGYYIKASQFLGLRNVLLAEATRAL